MTTDCRYMLSSSWISAAFSPPRRACGSRAQQKTAGKKRLGRLSLWEIPIDGRFRRASGREAAPAPERAAPPASGRSWRRRSRQGPARRPRSGGGATPPAAPAAAGVSQSAGRFWFEPAMGSFHCGPEHASKLCMHVRGERVGGGWGGHLRQPLAGVHHVRALAKCLLRRVHQTSEV